MGRALWRVIAVWAVSTVTMLALAGILPDFKLQSDDGDSATRIAITAALGAGAFGLLSALVWPLLVRALLLVPALVLGLLNFFLNGSLLLLALRLIPDGRGDANAETAVVVAAVMSAVASATGGALAVRDDDAVLEVQQHQLQPLGLRCVLRREGGHCDRLCGDAEPPVVERLHGVDEAHAFLPKDVRGGDPKVVEDQLHRRRGPQADAPSGASTTRDRDPGSNPGRCRAGVIGKSTGTLSCAPVSIIRG